MKKISRSFSKSYFPLTLWVEDLQEIVTILGEKTERIEIESREHGFESIQEAAQYFGFRAQNYLKISGYLPYSRIDFTNYEASIWIDGSGPEAARTFYEIDKILSGRQRRLAFLYSYWLIWAVVVGNLFVPNLLETYARIPSYITSGVGLAWILWSGYISVMRHSVIHFEARANARSFFQRNKDQLAVAVIAAIVGALLGALGTKVSDKFHFIGENPPSAVTDSKKQ